MKLVLLSDEVGPDTPIGGKGRALSALTDAGLPVPAWAVVPPEAFYESLGPSVSAALATYAGLHLLGRDPEHPRDVLARFQRIVLQDFQQLVHNSPESGWCAR